MVLPLLPTSRMSQLTPRSTSTLGCLALPRGGEAELGLPFSCLLSLLRISAGDSTGCLGCVARRWRLAISCASFCCILTSAAVSMVATSGPANDICDCTGWAGMSE